jgi:hypothetical protein
MLRALAQDEDWTPLTNGLIYYRYVSSDEHAAAIVRVMLHSSDFALLGVTRLLHNAYLFTENNSSDLWEHAAKHSQEQLEARFGEQRGQQYADWFTLFHDALTDSAQTKDVRRQLRAWIETFKSAGGYTDFFIALGNAAYLGAIDDEIVALMEPLERTPQQVSGVFSRVSWSVRLLASNGYKAALRSYSAKVISAGHITTSDILFVEALAMVVACRGYPSHQSDLKDAAFGSDEEEQNAGRRHVLAVYEFLAGEEFQHAVWHPGLGVWLDP